MPSNKWLFEYYSSLSKYVVIGEFILRDDAKLDDVEIFKPIQVSTKFVTKCKIKGDIGGAFEINVKNNFLEYKKAGMNRATKMIELHHEGSDVFTQLNQLEAKRKVNNLNKLEQQKLEALQRKSVMYSQLSLSSALQERRTDILIKNGSLCAVFLNRDSSTNGLEIVDEGNAIICDAQLIQSKIENHNKLVDSTNK